MALENRIVWKEVQKILESNEEIFVANFIQVVNLIVAQSFLRSLVAQSLAAGPSRRGVEGVKGPGPGPRGGPYMFCSIQFCYCYISLQCIFMAIDLL